MPAQEIPLELYGLALEGASTRGTAIAAPTHNINMDGAATPRKAKRRGSETRGTLIEYYRSKTVRKWGEWDASGPLDLNTFPVWLNMAVKSVTTPTGAGPYVWAFPPTLSADDIRTGTLFWGDPQWTPGDVLPIFQYPFSTVDEFTVTADSDSEDLVMLELAGQANYPTRIAAPAFPSQLAIVELIPQDMQLWIDATTIGTTAVTGRLASAKVTLTNNISYKRRANGPASALTYNAIGRGRRHLEMELKLELIDSTQFTQWEADTPLKTRLRLNGPLISGADYQYLQFDIYGPLGEDFDWDEVADTNRAITLNIISEANAGAADWSATVQNSRATLG